MGLLLTLLYPLQSASAPPERALAIPRRVAAGLKTNVWEYEWLDNGHVVECDADGNVFVKRVVATDSADPYFDKIGERLTRFSRAFVSATAGAFLYRVIPSPNGKRVLVLENEMDVGMSRFHVLDVKTGKISTVEPDVRPIGLTEGVPMWDRSSNNLVNFIGDESSALSIKWSVIEEGSGESSQSTRIHDWPGDNMRIRRKSRMIGVTKKGTGLIAEWKPKLENNLMLYEVDIRDGVQKTRKYSVSLPHNMIAEEIAMSPHGTTLAWKMYVPDPVVPDNDYLRNGTAELWLSDCDGSAMRFVTVMSQRVLRPDKRYFNNQPYKIRWAPDGKRVSYSLEHDIWLVSVDTRSATRSQPILQR